MTTLFAKASQLVGRLINSGVGPELTVTEVRRVRVTNTVALLGAVGIGAWVPMAAVAGHLPSVVENALASIGFLGAIHLERKGRHGVAVSLVLSLALFQVAWATALFGVSSASPLFFVSLATVPYLMFHRDQRPRAHAYSVLAALCGLASAVFADQLPQRIQLGDPAFQTLFNTASALTLLVVGSAAFARIVDRSEDALIAEHARAEALLLNVLPARIAKRLQVDPDQAIADRIDDATVLFADIVGFTELSARLPPEQVVQHLDAIFTRFDMIVADLGLEKIKTIGDAYMVAGGLPGSAPGAASAMARLALGMMAASERHSAETGEPLTLRIGIHSGPVVAGVIGRHRFLYDLWGDTVNIASRMESHGLPGRIQLSAESRDRLDPRFVLERRGMVEVKGRGPMETWFLVEDAARD